MENNIKGKTTKEIKGKVWEFILMYKNALIANPKGNIKYSYPYVIKLLEKLDPNQFITCEWANAKHLTPNAGTCVENTVKLQIRKYGHCPIDATKSLDQNGDLKLDELTSEFKQEYGLPATGMLEITFATSYSKGASIEKHDPKQPVLLLNQHGAYLGKVEDTIVDKDYRVKPTQPSYTKLEKLTKWLGY